MPKLVDLTNKRFGKLAVLGRLSSSRGGSVLWECLCDCGSSYQATTRHLNRKNFNIRSCGCDQFKSGTRHKQWSGYGDISGHWWSSHIKHSANSKGRAKCKLTLTPEDAFLLFLAQDERCCFTGEQLVISNDSKANTASLDRIDNTRGYELDNVRWVHKTVNMMKRIYGDDYFIEWCSKVASYSQSNGL